MCGVDEGRDDTTADPFGRTIICLPTPAFLTRRLPSLSYSSTPYLLFPLLTSLPTYLYTKLHTHSLQARYPEYPRKSWERRWWVLLERLGVGGKVWEGVGGLWFLVDARWVWACEAGRGGPSLGQEERLIDRLSLMGRLGFSICWLDWAHGLAWCGVRMTRYPTLSARLLGIRLIPSQPLGEVTRSISYEYMNRQLVWSGFTVSFCGRHP